MMPRIDRSATMRVTITDPAIAKAKRAAAADGKRRELADMIERGLRLRVTPAGTATWVLGCRDRARQARRFVLGNLAGHRPEGSQGSGAGPAAGRPGRGRRPDCRPAEGTGGGQGRGDRYRHAVCVAGTLR